jgi:tetratricopeptide (TPR) repeat protein
MPYAVMPPSEAGAKAKAAARRALEIDDTLSEAHVSLAFVTYSFDWDWEGGGRGFRRAIELDPDYAPAHYWYSLYLGQLGRVREALNEAERARELDPLSPIGTYAVGLAHYYDRRFDEAAQFALSGLEVAPSFAPSRRLLGSVYLAEGRHQEALDELRRLHESAADNSLHTAYLAHAYGRAGNRAKARELVAALIAESKTRFVPAAHIAIGYVGTGDVEDAFLWLDRAFDERSQALTFLKIDPLFDALKKDPRYPDLLRRVGFAR